MKRECKGLRKHHSKRKSLSKCYFRREWKWKYLQMSKNITTDCLSYQLWWMIFIPIQAFATCTINFDPVPLTDNPAFASLSNVPMEVFNPMPSTPPELTTLQTPTLQSSSFEDNRVSEDVIQSLVIPSKSKGVETSCKREKERLRCALKLLPFFIILKELSNSIHQQHPQQTAARCDKTSSIEGASV